MTDPDREAKLAELIERFNAVGEPDARLWAEGEVDDNEACLAYFLFMRDLWSRTINRWRADTSWLDHPAGRHEAVRQALDLGVKRETLGVIAASVALDVVFDLLIKLDDGHDPQAPADYPGWTLMETDADGTPTGRRIDGFHVGLLMMDPSGNEGRDIQ